MAVSLNLPEPTICDFNCFYKRNHDGPHQFEDSRSYRYRGEKVATNKKDSIAIALDNLAEAAHSLALHGAGGYTVDTSALDAVFVRSLHQLNSALEDSIDSDKYDPYGDIYNVLPE